MNRYINKILIATIFTLPNIFACDDRSYADLDVPPLLLLFEGQAASIGMEVDQTTQNGGRLVQIDLVRPPEDSDQEPVLTQESFKALQAMRHERSWKDNGVLLQTESDMLGVKKKFCIELLCGLQE